MQISAKCDSAVKFVNIDQYCKLVKLCQTFPEILATSIFYPPLLSAHPCAGADALVDENAGLVLARAELREQNAELQKRIEGPKLFSAVLRMIFCK